ERVLTRLENEMPDAEAELQRMMDRAQSLPDGPTVFKNKHGEVVTEDNELIDQEEAASIEWLGNEPSYETYLAQRKRVQETKDSIYEIRVYQTDVLGNVRSELTDPSHSGSVEDVQNSMGKIFDQIPNSLRSEIKQDISEPATSHTSAFSIPERVL
ncbi:MAG: hypothetical protein JKY99_03975, partial [Rhizobiales bacterium]|nr:hypothetical protein [Hyphomicrobiales bacterium]